MNLDALKEALNKGNKVIYSDSRDTHFFNLRRDEHWDPINKEFVADVRLAVKPGTNGFGFRAMHFKVGWPGKDVKSFTCPRSVYGGDSPCITCDVYAMRNDKEAIETRIDFPGMKDGIPVMKPTPIAEIIKKLEPGPRMILVVMEPDFFGKEDAPADMQGVQVWFVDKRTLVGGLSKLFKKYPADYFSDPANGVAIRVTFDPAKAATEMYSVTALSAACPIDPEICKSAPDAEFYTSKVQTQEAMLEKLREMLPGQGL